MSKSRNHVAKELWTPKFRPKRIEDKRKYPIKPYFDEDELDD